MANSKLVRARKSERLRVYRSNRKASVIRVDFLNADSGMTSAEFRAWRKRVGMTNRDAAIILGLQFETVRCLCDTSPIPLVVELACCEIERRLSGEGWPGY